jgi:hypothetical protein
MHRGKNLVLVDRRSSRPQRGFPVAVRGADSFGISGRVGDDLSLHPQTHGASGADPYLGVSVGGFCPTSLRVECDSFALLVSVWVCPEFG